MNRLTDPQRTQIRNDLTANANTDAGKSWRGLDLMKLSDDELISYDQFRRRMVPLESGIETPDGRLVWNQAMNNRTGGFEFIPKAPPVAATVVNCGGGQQTPPTTAQVQFDANRSSPRRLAQIVANGVIRPEDVGRLHPDDVEMVQLAGQVKDQVVNQLIEKLVAPYDPSQRDAIAANYRNLPYKVLEQMAAALPAPTTAQQTNNQSQPPAQVPSWAMASGPAPGAVVHNQQGLSLPKYDWKAMRPART